MENALRGYHDLQWAIEQAARHGMSPEDALIIYQNQGRPMAVSNIQKALARGGVFKPQPGELTDPFEASIVEGNLKPAYYDLAKQLRFTMPSAFAIRQLAQSGVWDAAQTAKVLKESGWVPEYADQVAAAWASNSSAATAQPWAKRAETQLWTATHKGYIGGEVTESEADAALVSIGVGQQERAEVFRLWNEEKNITVKPLTPSQIKRAYKSNELTIDDAVARLELQHYTDADARTYLTS